MKEATVSKNNPKNNKLYKKSIHNTAQKNDSYALFLLKYGYTDAQKHIIEGLCRSIKKEQFSLANLKYLISINFTYSNDFDVISSAILSCTKYRKEFLLHYNYFTEKNLLDIIKDALHNNSNVEIECIIKRQKLPIKVIKYLLENTHLAHTRLLIGRHVGDFSTDCFRYLALKYKSNTRLHAYILEQEFVNKNLFLGCLEAFDINRKEVSNTYQDFESLDAVAQTDFKHLEFDFPNDIGCQDFIDVFYLFEHNILDPNTATKYLLNGEVKKFLKAISLLSEIPYKTLCLKAAFDYQERYFKEIFAKGGFDKEYSQISCMILRYVLDLLQDNKDSLKSIESFKLKMLEFIKQQGENFSLPALRYFENYLKPDSA